MLTLIRVDLTVGKKFVFLSSIDVILFIFK